MARLLEVRQISKSFGSTQALRRASFSLDAGEGRAVAVKEAAKIGKVKIIAMDRNETALEFIEQGIIEASIAQRTYTMTYLGLELLYDLDHNSIQLVNNWKEAKIIPLPRNVDTGTIVIDETNVRLEGVRGVTEG
jgi:ribose transport system substrate-binding protein